jgi:hypothetical protein
MTETIYNPETAAYRARLGPAASAQVIDQSAIFAPRGGRFCDAFAGRRLWTIATRPIA